MKLYIVKNPKSLPKSEKNINLNIKRKINIMTCNHPQFPPSRSLQSCCLVSDLNEGSCT